MKKILTLVFVLVSFFILMSVSVYADVPLPMPTTIQSIPEPGSNCGDPNATDVNIQKCCYYKPYTAPELPATGNVIIDAFLSPLNSFFKLSVGDKVLIPLNNVVTKTIQPCMEGEPSTPGDVGNPSCKCVKPVVAPLDSLKPLCNNVSLPGENSKCLSCLSGGAGSVGIWTGLGCIYTNPTSFIKEIVAGWGIGVAGGFALLCIIYAAFQMQTSQGNPEKLKKAQEMITSCIMGLMLIIFSVFILRLIGVTILQIPGFG